MSKASPKVTILDSQSEHDCLIVDIDGTLCPVKKSGEAYQDLVPYAEMVERLKKWQLAGYRIILFTARNMRTHQGKIGLLKKHTAPILLDWIAKWDIPCDELILGKPWPGPAGFYLDDRAIRPDEFVTLSETELRAKLDQSAKDLQDACATKA